MDNFDLNNQNNENQNNEIQNNNNSSNDSYSSSSLNNSSENNNENYNSYTNNSANNSNYTYNNGYTNSNYSNGSYSSNNGYSGGGYGNNGPEPFRTTSFYSESYKKANRKNGNGLFQLILVAVISSILGGTVVGGFLQFVVPAAQPSVRGFFDKLIPGSTLSSGSNQNDSGIYKKVEIVGQADSPVSAIAEKVGPSVVGIKVTPKTAARNDFSFFFSGGQQQAPSEGSGIIIKSDGTIMTNNHVIEGAMDTNGQMAKGAKIEVFLPGQIDKPYAATVVGWDRKTDLAVIKIDASNLPAAELGNSDQLKVGELAVAIGNPGGLDYMGSVTVGVISGLNRKVQTEDGKEMTYVQTDAAINPGNSGGALVNSKGQVIGINTIKVSATGFEGLGFAIPVNKAKEITDSLIENKPIQGRPPVLGIQVESRYTEAIAKQYNMPMGVYVADVTPLSGAYIAGIKANDVITKFDDVAIKSFDDLNAAKNKHKPGDTVKVEVYRDGEYKTFSVKLTEDKG